MLPKIAIGERSADRMIPEVGIERDVGRQRARRIGHDQGVAIRRRVCDLFDRDRAPGARTVVDDDGLVVVRAMRSNTTRATMSVTPAAANGTTTLMVCLG